MAIPTTRDEFSNWCLRRLGAPVTSINLSSEQIDDCVDLALSKFQRNHYNGTELVYIPTKITQSEINAKAITVPAQITGVTRVFSFYAGSSASVLNTGFILASDAMWQAIRGSGGMADYQLLMNYRSLIQQLTAGEKPIRFNRILGKVHIDADWTQIPLNSYLVLEGWSAIDAATNALIWGDEWLQAYAVQLIKRDAGTVLKKYTNAQLPGGLVVDGQGMYDEAVAEIIRLEEQLADMYAYPAMMAVG